jgi:hypothetical protein
LTIASALHGPERSGGKLTVQVAASLRHRRRELYLRRQAVAT